MATTAAGRMLTRQLQQMQSDKDIPGISCGLVDSNIFEWEVMLMISDDVKLYGGMYHYPILPAARGPSENIPRHPLSTRRSRYQTKQIPRDIY